jgi:hypothetical protein
MTDESGADVSVDRAWRATMMANSARDPYWQASVGLETFLSPNYQAVIEDKCATCHMPMARLSLLTEGGEVAIFGDGLLDPAHRYHTLALDGVSCTLCHQIAETGFGQLESFSGGFVVDLELPPGERLAYGPFPVGRQQAAVMQAASGFVPVESPHIERSELCATCHTLYTPYVDDTGQIAGEFPEQVPYLEWLHSDYRDTQACQDCHMPLADGGVRLSTTGGPPRGPFFQHVFAGGNAYMLGVLSRFGGELGVVASSDQLDAKAARTVEQLEDRTAAVTLEEVVVSGGQLSAVVAVENLAGHKLPTGFPARRAWLHVVVQDADGEAVFESGAVAPDGSMPGNDNDADGTAFEPHHLIITDPEQVQIYESIMRDANGAVTTTLLRAAGYVKDNRLLPAGFDPATADRAVAVWGAASEDEDFVGGGDRVRYLVDLGETTGPYTLVAELLYQSIGYRWAEKARGYDVAEAQRFLSYYEAVPNLPVLISADRIEVDGGSAAR